MSALNGKRGKGVALNADVFMDRDFLENWLVGSEDETDNFIEQYAADWVSFTDKTAIVNGKEEKLMYIDDKELYFDRFMNLNRKCSVCGNIHPVNDVDEVLMLPDCRLRPVCNECSGEGKVKSLYKDGKIVCTSVAGYNYEICYDAQKYSFC